MMQIHGIGLATPGEAIAQDDLLEVAYRYNTESRPQRLRLKRIYRGSKVQQRHSVLTDGATTVHDAMENILSFYEPSPQSLGPSTRQRMAVYQDKALPLSVRACHSALKRSGVPAQGITQLVTVSCTGFAAPGVDAGLIDALGLSATVGRTNVGFMGCHGAINGLRVADALVAANPDERVLLCCTELCTLHFQYGSDPQNAVTNALFADGAAALVGAGPAGLPDAPTTRGFISAKIPATAEMMGWYIGDHGFQMRLEPQVSGIIERELKPAIDAWLAGFDLSCKDIRGWAIHPGGPKILDAVDTALELPPGASDLSRAVLRDYGNMSSPTVLFILDAMLREQTPRPWVVLGFGPGLSIEAGLIV